MKRIANILGTPAYLPSDMSPIGALRELAINPAFVRVGVPESAILAGDFSRIDGAAFYSPGKQLIISLMDWGDPSPNRANWLSDKMTACVAIARRYPNCILEPMNEPDTNAPWVPSVATSGTPALYGWIADVFAAVYPAVKRAALGVTVIGPTMGYWSFDTIKDLSTPGFCADGFDVHDYDFNAYPHGNPSLPSLLAFLRKLMPMPIYVTELELNTASTAADVANKVNLLRAYGAVVLGLQSPFNGSPNDATATWIDAVPPQSGPGTMRPHMSAFIQAAGAQ